MSARVTSRALLLVALLVAVGASPFGALFVGGCGDEGGEGDEAQGTVVTTVGGRISGSRVDGLTVGVALKRKIAADMRAQHVDGFPFVIIGGVAVNGYDPSAFEQLLSMN